MGRPLKSAIVDNEKTLKTRFTNRLTSMKKKAHELSILCDIPVGIICYRESDKKFHTWPENAADFNEIVTRYRNTERKKKKESNVGVEKMDDRFAELVALNERKRWIDSQLEAVRDKIDFLKAQKSSER